MFSTAIILVALSYGLHRLSRYLMRLSEEKEIEEIERQRFLHEDRMLQKYEDSQEQIALRDKRIEKTEHLLYSRGSDSEALKSEIEELTK
jgi:hypothetical protein